MKSLKKTDANLDRQLDEKRLNRQQLRYLLHDFSREMPIIGISLDNNSADDRDGATKGQDEMDFTFLRELLQGASSLKVPFVIFQNKKFEQKVPFDLYDFVNVVVIDSRKTLNGSDHLFSGCDAVICFSEKSVDDCFVSGIVPIASVDLRNAVNYDPNHETGNSFVFEKKDAWQIFAATVRAIETYRFPFDWKWIIRNGRKC